MLQLITVSRLGRLQSYNSFDRINYSGYYKGDAKAQLCSARLRYHDRTFFPYDEQLQCEVPPKSKNFSSFFL